MAVIHLRKGDDFEAQVDCKRDGVAEDMTGWTLEADMRYANCAPVVLTVAWETIATGIAVVSLAATSTSSLHVGEYELQVRAIDPDGKKSSSRPVTVIVRD